MNKSVLTEAAGIIAVQICPDEDRGVYPAGREYPQPWNQHRTGDEFLHKQLINACVRIQQPQIQGLCEGVCLHLCWRGCKGRAWDNRLRTYTWKRNRASQEANGVCGYQSSTLQVNKRWSLTCTRWGRLLWERTEEWERRVWLKEQEWKKEMSDKSENRKKKMSKLTSRKYKIII